MPATPPPGTQPVRTAHRFDETALQAYLDQHLPSSDGPLQIWQFRGGQSNPTFLLQRGEQQLVLRKKPPGKLLPSAHAVEREFRVIRALASTPVPVPTGHLLCEDPSLIGTPFYLMQHVEGRIFRDLSLGGLDRQTSSQIYDQLVVVLAAIHAVDIDAVGLGSYGKRGDYVARQVRRWSRQYQASRTEEIPPMERLMAWLPENLPPTGELRLAHGDYRLDNLVFDRHQPRCLAVLDWELSTLGDPLADLAYVAMLYQVDLPGIGGLVGIDLDAAGVPSEEALVERYRQLSGRREIPAWPTYKAFSMFRLAAIAQGVYKRSLLGNASSETAGRFGAAVWLLSRLACGLVGLEQK